MKKIIIMILVFLFLIKNSLSICCTPDQLQVNQGIYGGCFEGRTICCNTEIDGEKELMGFIGCKAELNPGSYANYCPGERLGPCLICDELCTNDEECTWIKTFQNCPEEACIFTPASGTPTAASTCSVELKCGEGEVMCPAGECKAREACFVACEDNMCISGKYCCNIATGGFEAGRNSVCSGDFDVDTVCDFVDNCPNIANQDQRDEDGDRIGDVCDKQEECYTSYNGMCCDIAGLNTRGVGKFYGYMDDCPRECGKNPCIGCYDFCEANINGGWRSCKPSACIDGKRIIECYDESGAILNSFTEECTTIQLIPFFTTFSIFSTLSFLALFYLFRNKF